MTASEGLPRNAATSPYDTSHQDVHGHDSTDAGTDPFLWLEEVNGDKALAWVRARNADSVRQLCDSEQRAGFEALKDSIRSILDSDARIPQVTSRGKFLYNFWRDDKNPAGIWRRTTLAEYAKAEPQWEMLLDLDALAEREGSSEARENPVWHVANVLKAGGYRHALLNISRGGADATVVREFDIETRQFVVNGFVLDEAKNSVAWIDKDNIYVATDFGPDSLTSSGYARVVKRWQRGTPLADAVTVYEGQHTDMRVGAVINDTPGFIRHFIYRRVSFYEVEWFLLDADGTLQKVDTPPDAEIADQREWLTIKLRSDWRVADKTWLAGSLLVTRFDDFMAGQRDFTALYTPTPAGSLVSYSWTRKHLILNVVEDVKNCLSLLSPDENWRSQPLDSAPANATLWAWGIDADESDDFFVMVTGFANPPALYLSNSPGHPHQALTLLKQTPAFFDTSSLQVSQHFATSQDGTRIPYFQVSRFGLEMNGLHPTLLYGYGGFEQSLMSQYDAVVGKAWLAKGGVYVVANIRGGGEYGPRWHQAALREKRPRGYEDFAAVAEDLIRRGITSPAHLGARGASNGGLLAGNMLTKYPQLFGAIVCEVPLLDMQRYTHLLAGASWIAEYGDPDQPQDWTWLQTFSPYHNLKSGVKYPPSLFTTSTRDDRVHPAHARKMAARIQALGADVLSYENVEGGHGGAANNAQRAFMTALAYSFLWQKLL